MEMKMKMKMRMTMKKYFTVIVLCGREMVLELGFCLLCDLIRVVGALTYVYHF